MKGRGDYLPISSVDVDKEEYGSPVRNSSKGWHPCSKQTAGLLVFAFLSVTVFSWANWANWQESPSSPVLESSHSSHSHNSGGEENKEQPMFDNDGRYVMYNFDEQKQMANFLPGLGGYWGTPMWVFYVNRGQGVSSFGIQNKDGAIAKYNSAEKVYQQVAYTGFRTFVRGKRGDVEWGHMPFIPTKGKKPARHMSIGMNVMQITEVDDSIINLQTDVEYLPVTNQNFPGLARLKLNELPEIRRTTFTNIAKNGGSLELQVLDGLGKLFPWGIPNYNLDAMGRTMEAWMNVYNMGAGSNKTQPFYHVSQGTADTAQVQIVVDGHFVVAFIETADGQYSDADLLPFIVDPEVVFGTDTTLTDPSKFIDPSWKEFNLDEFMQGPQTTTSRTPCAFAGAKVSLAPGRSVTITSVYGHAPDLNTFVSTVTPIILGNGFLRDQEHLASELVNNITSFVVTKTSSPVFDKYVQQDFLDNILRGGLPVPLGDPINPKIYHTFSRIHGDLERDYNWYQIDTTYYSQGPGNFRDVNQNRRNDVMHVPSVGDFNVRMFLSFVQVDGYNPLTVASTNFVLSAEAVASLVPNFGIPAEQSQSATKITAVLTTAFRIGTLFQQLAAEQITITQDPVEFLQSILSVATQVPAAQYAQNGFWADHWTYTLDLAENYNYVFPEKAATLLYDSEPVPFFMSPAIVNARIDRYSLAPDPDRPQQFTVRSYNAVCQWGDSSQCFPQSRIDAMNAIYSDPNYVADPYGAGGAWQRDTQNNVVTVSVFSKFLILGVLKFSTLDPLGMGVEYEGGKPGWNDAMNGLPGLIGSGMPETFEMLRILQFLLHALQRDGRSVSVPQEFSVFLSQTAGLLEEYKPLFSNPDANVTEVEFSFWDRSNSLRENYRSSLVANFNGAIVQWEANTLISILEAMIAKTEVGISRSVAMTADGMTPTYFYYEATSYDIVPDTRPAVPPMVSRPPIIIVKSFKVHTVPLFLEGPTRHMKIVSNSTEKKEIYEKTKSSALYDSFLKMFTISASLASCLQGIGRMMAFSPGWLENQSVWLHMSYKFYLELLRGGLYEQFFDEIKTGLVPFMNNERYGRSAVEAASFVVSSAFPDKSLHGTGFLARLSGSTAEFLSMWAIMFAGHNPFFLDDNGALCLQLVPVIPGWMFTDDSKTVSFTFMGHTTVTYHNPDKYDTWTISPKSATLVADDGTVTNTPSGTAVFTGDTLVNLVRQQQVKSIDVYF